MSARPWLLPLCLLIGYLVAAPLVMSALSTGPTTIPYSTLLGAVAQGDISEVVQTTKAAYARPAEGSDVFMAVLPGAGTMDIEGDLRRVCGAPGAHCRADFKFGAAADPPDASGLLSLALTIGLPLLLLIVILRLARAGPMAAGGGLGGMGIARLRMAGLDATQPKVTFAEVAGADEAVDELREIVDFLRRPERYAALGARVPRGVLLMGPPGTGKTLLARAVAGEADVPFFIASASEFVELVAGIGAARVRDLFERARRHAPSIIFIDELDGIGRAREGARSHSGGADDREQALNQILVEMDGFDANAGVIVLAATNRPDTLDAALLRPGRFDRKVVVDAPDLAGREAILRVHAWRKPLTATVDLAAVARATVGLTGADLANLLNEAAIAAGSRGASEILPTDVAAALDRATLGVAVRSRPLGHHERDLVAIHEAGHALVRLRLPAAEPLRKVTIVRHGSALGLTVSSPDADSQLHSRTQLAAELAVAVAGRAAEWLLRGERTTDAADDLARATGLARDMILRFGMGQNGPPAAVARSASGTARGSKTLRREIDRATAVLLAEAEATATAILLAEREPLAALAAALLAQETLDAAGVAGIVGSSPQAQPA